MGILICGDFVPTASNEKLFSECSVEELFGKELIDLMRQMSYRVINLETPLVDSVSPCKKYGPNLSAPTKSTNVLKALNINLAALANNHILDQGEAGLFSTIHSLTNNDIEVVGIGCTSDEASKPFLTKVGDLKIGFYACVEHEFSFATHTTAGANAFDPIHSFDQVSELKKTCDYCIVLYHGGKEYYRYPSPGLQAVCRKFVDRGADLVICQHSHCIGCEEKYNNGTIVYGQGNFLFDRNNNEYVDTGLLIAIEENLTIQYIPVVKDGCRVRLADKYNREKILDNFFKRSQEIQADSFIMDRYNEFSELKLSEYLIAISGKKNLFIYKVLYRLFGERYKRRVISKVYHENGILALIDYFDCEAHRELILNGLRGAVR